MEVRPWRWNTEKMYVLVGDVLFAHALCLASDYDTTDVCRTVARATSRVCSETRLPKLTQRLNWISTAGITFESLNWKQLSFLRCLQRGEGIREIWARCRRLARFWNAFGLCVSNFWWCGRFICARVGNRQNFRDGSCQWKIYASLLILLESMEEAERATWIDLYKSGQTDRALQGLEAMLGRIPL